VQFTCGIPCPRVIAPHELETPEYALLAEMRHASLAEFVIEYFIRRTSWLTWLHHAMSVATIVAVVWICFTTDRSWKAILGDFGLATFTLFLIILPLHELLHALAYRLAGARDIRWNYSLRMAAVWVIAHRFVATARPFVFVALAPFVLNVGLIAGAIAFPKLAVYLLFVLLWHLHGAIGDWSLLNFIWLHRHRGFWTYDDAESGISYFYGRSA
jgi:Putative zincin peptidase